MFFIFFVCFYVKTKNKKVTVSYLVAIIAQFLNGSHFVFCYCLQHYLPILNFESLRVYNYNYIYCSTQKYFLRTPFIPLLKIKTTTNDVIYAGMCLKLNSRTNPQRSTKHARFPLNPQGCNKALANYIVYECMYKKRLQCGS